MECPNCGAHIGRFDLKPNCMNCGVNIFYSQQERLLSNDAKKCELEFASARIFAQKLKTAFINGPLQITRMVLTFLCLGALFVPFAGVHIALPLFERTISLWGYGLYTAFTDGSLSALASFLDIELTADIARMAILIIGSMLFLLVIDVILFVTELLSFLGVRRSCKVMVAVSAVGITAGVASAVFCLLLGRADEAFALSTVSTSSSFGAIVAILCYTGMMIVNIIMLGKNIVPVYEEVDLQRVAVHKRIKSGELTYDDLPMPVFESDEERARREKSEPDDNSSEREAGVEDE